MNANDADAHVKLGYAYHAQGMYLGHKGYIVVTEDILGEGTTFGQGKAPVFVLKRPIARRRPGAS